MKLIETSIRRRVTVFMFTVAIVLFGFVSFTRLKINLLPELNYPTLTVRTDYPGAAPAEIENLVSKPIEEIIGVVKNVRKVSSISKTGQSDVLLEFEWGTRMDYAILEVREKLDSLEFPQDVKRPTILRFDPSMDPIIRMGFFRESDSASPGALAKSQTLNEEQLKTLRRFADEQLKKELESVLGVAAVKISGGLEDEIQVLVDQGKLSQLKIPIETIGTILGAENVNLSGGRLEEGTRQFLVRTLNQFRSLKEIENVIITSVNGVPVYLKDVAIVKQGSKERDTVIRFRGQEAVEVAIYKEGDANTVLVSRGVMERLEAMKYLLPSGYKLVSVYDQATFINNAVNEVVQSALIGGILAIFILYFFLRNIWTTLIISISIPVSVITTFNLMYGTNLTLNIMSLGGIALGIGMLVDNSIVVLENISRHKAMGKDAYSSALEGTNEVAGAVSASTLTTVAVFFPLVFVKGIAGQLFSDQALTITFSLIASLAVALTLVPMLAGLSKNKNTTPTLDPTESPAPPRTAIGRGIKFIRVFIFTTIPTFVISIIIRTVRSLSHVFSFILSPFLKFFDGVYNSLEKRYPIMLLWSLAHKGTVLIIALLLFVFSLLLVPQLGVDLIPQLSQGEFGVEFRLPPGTPLSRTDALISGAEKSSVSLKNVHMVFSVSGGGNRMDANPEQGGENWGEMSVVMTPGSKRFDEDQTMNSIRENLDKIPGLQYKFFRPTLFTFETPVEVEIAGFDLDKLKQISLDIAGKMQQSERFTDVKSSMEMGSPEIRIRFDREKIAQLGLPVYLVADRVVNKIRGDVATRYSWHDRKIDILVRAREEDRKSIEDIRKIIINPESQFPVTLDAVAEIATDMGPGEIRRAGQERVALVTANLKSGDLGAAAQEINQIITKTPIPNDMTIRQSGQNEEMDISFQSLKFALLLAVFLVYLVMASQFESFIHPFVILFSIPLALIGSIFGLWITGYPITVVVLIGLILLAGIVVNNAIVLIDFIKQLREQGMKKVDAILAAGRSRLRPILMTMLTTVLGLLPMSLGLGEGAEMQAPMAITVIGGLSISTLLTLIVIPVIYALVDRKE